LNKKIFTWINPHSAKDMMHGVKKNAKGLLVYPLPDALRVLRL